MYTSGAGGSWKNVYSLTGITATGGIETTYASGGTTYKVHTFNSNGTFVVNSAAPGSSVSYLLIGGGG